MSYYDNWLIKCNNLTQKIITVLGCIVLTYIIFNVWLNLCELSVGIISSQVFAHLGSFKVWIQTEACVVPRDVNQKHIETELLFSPS